MSDDDISYYRRRAEAELERAQQATKPEVVKAHYELANAYLECIDETAKRIENAWEEPS
jgi:hypothetical protein